MVLEYLCSLFKERDISRHDTFQSNEKIFKRRETSRVSRFVDCNRIISLVRIYLYLSREIQFRCTVKYRFTIIDILTLNIFRIVSQTCAFFKKNNLPRSYYKTLETFLLNIVPRPRLFRESLRRSIIPTTRTTVRLVWNVVKFQPANISSGSQKALLFHRAPHLYRADRERIRIPIAYRWQRDKSPSPSSSLAGGGGRRERERSPRRRRALSPLCEVARRSCEDTRAR